MAYDAKKIYYRFDASPSRLVLDYEASRQISPESENLYHGSADRPVRRGTLFVEHNVKRGSAQCRWLRAWSRALPASRRTATTRSTAKVAHQGKLHARGYSIERSGQ